MLLYNVFVNPKTYRKVRVVTTFFVGMLMAVAVSIDSYVLAAASVATGMLFLILVRTKAKIKVDERNTAIQEKAARMTYAIFAPTIGVGAFLLLLPSKSGFSVFSKGEFLYLESLGMVFAYLALFMIVLYSLSYYYYSRKLGGGGSDE